VSQGTAIAHPNIALVKYWGKQPGPGNLPATPSLSITLDTLTTTTSVTTSSRDLFVLNGESVEDAKIRRFLTELRCTFEVPPLEIETENNFPTGCGLASSASGFAALITAIDRALGLNMDVPTRSSWARRGSGSAARSIVGGFGVLRDDGVDWTAQQVLEPREWPLKVVIGVTAREKKSISSTEGMEHSRLTSPFFTSWVQSTENDFDFALEAVADRDFDALARIAEASCLKLHALMFSSEPGLIYWNGATVDGLHRIRSLRKSGVPAFFTVDAGPQVKAVCAPTHLNQVIEAIAALPGVKDVLVAGLGDGAR
jgi:diphosphomevalonate decarboxylase